MTCPPPPIQRNHKGWRSAPDAILPGHRRHPSGSRQGHPRYTGAVATGGRGWPDTNDTSVNSRCNDASSKHSKTPVLRQTTHDSRLSVETVESMDTKQLIVGTSRRPNLKVKARARESRNPK